MPEVRKLIKEENIRIIFRLSLITKGVLALSEIIVGLLTYLVTQQFLVTLVTTLTRDELSEDPKDFISNYLLSGAKSLSPHTQHFAALYLISHGVIKLWLIVGLLRKKLWYYPTSIIIFGLFIAYQMIRFTSTHSFWLLLITVLDLIVIVLTLYEWRHLRKTMKGNSKFI